MEDTKDSVWVVHVLHERSHAFLRTEDWRSFTRKVTGFGVRVGMFDCSRDWRLVVAICKDESIVIEKMILFFS